MEKLTITLAGQKYDIQPLTVGQLQDLHIGVVEPTPTDPVEGTRKWWSRNVALIAIALSSDHPQMTADIVGKMRLGSLTAVKETVDDILDFAGIIERKAPKPGEAQAATE